MHLVLDAAGDDGNLHGPYQQPAELGADVEGAVLRDNQEVAVGRVKGRVGVHALAGGVDEHPQALLERGIAGAGHEPHAGDEVQVARLVVVKGVPSQLVGDVAQLGGVGALLLGARRLGGRPVGRMCARGQDAIQPGLLVLVAGRREGGSGELLGVEAVGGLLGGVLGNGEGALDGFGSGSQFGLAVSLELHDGSWFHSFLFAGPVGTKHTLNGCRIHSGTCTAPSWQTP